MAKKPWARVCWKDGCQLTSAVMLMVDVCSDSEVVGVGATVSMAFAHLVLVEVREAGGAPVELPERKMATEYSPP